MLNFTPSRFAQEECVWIVTGAEKPEIQKTPPKRGLEFMVVRGGLEPSACGFSVRCSTN